MSEEIALASADMAHVARLQELVNHWCIAARDLDAALVWAERERDAARAERDYWRVQAQDTLVDLHAAEAERDTLRLALLECADGLESAMQERYTDMLDYPHNRAKLERDLEPVARARAAIAKAKDGVR